MNKKIILYVDASIVHDITTISLYDQTTNAGLVLKVNSQIFGINNINDAEELAIFHAILYSKKCGYQKSIILNDNESAVKKYLNFEKQIRISWIPREINVVADKLSKLENNTKQKDINLLKFLFLKFRA